MIAALTAFSFSHLRSLSKIVLSHSLSLSLIVPLTRCLSRCLVDLSLSLVASLARRWLASLTRSLSLTHHMVSDSHLISLPHSLSVSSFPLSLSLFVSLHPFYLSHTLILRFESCARVRSTLAPSKVATMRYCVGCNARTD